MTGEVTLDGALDALRTVAAGVDEVDEDLAVERLLEKITSRPEPSQLRDALVLVGAREVLRGARGR